MFILNFTFKCLREIDFYDLFPLLINRPDNHILVIGDAAVNDRLLAGVDDDKRKVDD